MAEKLFLSASWQKLVMANYAVNPSILLPYLPYKTEIDLYQGQCFVSLVGFLFANTKIKGIRFPFHHTFPEVNLRFYVRHQVGNEWRRGVVFVSEIVPKAAIAWVANTLYNEHYIYNKMNWHHRLNKENLELGYSWRQQGNWNKIAVETLETVVPLPAGSKEEFIFEHYFGYSKMSDAKTGSYRVAHPRWSIHPVNKYTIDCGFEAVYGSAFGHLKQVEPDSVFVADGSVVNIYERQVIV